MVDAILGDPFYLPTYAETVSELIQKNSQNNNLYDMSTAILTAGGVPILSGKEHFALVIPNKAPTKASGQRESHRHWESSLKHRAATPTYLEKRAMPTYKDLNLRTNGPLPCF